VLDDSGAVNVVAGRVVSAAEGDSLGCTFNSP
jgi:hypothetical protein